MRIIKWLAIFCGIGLLIYLGFVIYAAVAFSAALDPFHSKQELIDNFAERQKQILDLKKYFRSIVRKDHQVEIEFESDNKLFRFGISPIDTITGSIVYPIFLEWDLNTNSDKVDSIIRTIGWTQQTLKTIKKKLDEANCIQIESGEPTKIGWQRSGMGMYYYNVFDNPITANLKNRYKNSCSYIVYNEKLILEYGGGAIGSQCFPKN